MGPANFGGTIDAFANSSSQLRDCIALRARHDFGASDARKEAAVAAAVRHEISGERARQGKSSGGISSHCSRGIQNQHFCNRILKTALADGCAEWRYFFGGYGRGRDRYIARPAKHRRAAEPGKYLNRPHPAIRNLLPRLLC